ncbi:MAG: N-acetylmuramoyl-L-alanine amidase [Legionellaceae bacterium]
MNRYVLAVMLWIGLDGSCFAASLNAVHLQVTSAGTQVACRLSGPFQSHVFTLSNPERVVLDFVATNAGYGVLQGIRAQGVVSRVRSGHPNPQTLRLVFEVKRKVRVISSRVNGRGASQFNLTLLPQGSGTLAPSPHAMPHSSVSVAPAPVHRYAPTRHRGIVVVIDPGHGGKDPGARGPHGSLEKNVVLGLSEKLKLLIDHEPGMRAVLTRRGDYYVGLRERLNIARKNNADVFIAIHSDAFVNSHSNGASVFALSQRGATSEAARWLAEKENHSELGGVNLKGLDDRNGLIRTVLIDLSQTATITSGLHLGAEILRDLGKMTRLHNHRVEQARFVVLKSPDIPSILIETGFISNPSEERNLTNSRYQMRLARAILGGLKRYFWEYPPHANPSTGN